MQLFCLPCLPVSQTTVTTQLFITQYIFGNKLQSQSLICSFLFRWCFSGMERPRNTQCWRSISGRSVFIFPKYALQQQGFFRYLQVRSYVRLHLPGFQRAGPDKLDDCLKQFAGFKNIISCLYSTLQSLAPASSNTIKAGWEAELGVQLSEETWDKCLRYVNTCSINTRHCLIQFKILHRLHYLKIRLHRIFPDVAPQCDKCCFMESTFVTQLCPVP